MKDKTTTTAPILRTRERKIGNTTFIVSTVINTEKERDIGAIISRLIELEEAVQTA